MKVRVVARWGSVFAFAFASSACVHVHAWERGKLAHPTMTVEQAGPALEHVYSVQEGAAGGDGAATSGCGCN